MNFKSLALGSLLALGSIFGSVSSAQAAPATCWVAAPGETADATYCDHYLPENGEHVVYMDGTKFEFHLYKGGDAVIFVNGASGADGTWFVREDGDIQVRNSHSGYWFVWSRD